MTRLARSVLNSQTVLSEAGPVPASASLTGGAFVPDCRRGSDPGPPPATQTFKTELTESVLDRIFGLNLG